MAKPRVALTMGDPSGIGPETIAKALPAIAGLGHIIVIGDSRVFGRACRSFKLPPDLSFDFLEMANVAPAGFAFGKVRREYGKASLEYVDEALKLIDRGLADCLVTCPVSKESVNLAHKGFHGHTEYLARRAGDCPTVMMLLNRCLRFGLVTTHVPLARVAGSIDGRKVRQTVSITERSLRQWFAISRPRVAVAGINPHASDNGVIGNEENKVLIPALAPLKKKGLRIEGPLPADTCCARALAGEYDAVIAMYHDQALIPLKTTDPSSGVNLTLGLPYVRTSPLHGTAFDIAGTGKASPDSLIAAVRAACRCATLQRKA